MTTDSKHRLSIAPNVLKREFVISAPNKAWVSDITYISTDEGWLYLAGIKELFNGELVGYAMSERMTKGLVIQALLRAATKKRPPIGFVLHSDRGSQYCAYDYQNQLKQFGITASMSRKANCWDNAPIESFGEYLKMNWCIIGNSRHDNKPFRRLPTSKSFITDSASKKD